MAQRDAMALIIEDRLRISMPTRDDLGHIADEVAAALHEANRAVEVPDPEDAKACPLRHVTAQTTEKSPISGEVKQQLKVLDMTCLRERCGWWSKSAGCCGVAAISEQMSDFRAGALPVEVISTP